MKKETSSIVNLLVAIIAIFIGITFSIEKTSTGLHIHDTYFVMGAATKWILFMVLSAFIGSFTGALFCKFRNRLYTRMLLLSTILIFVAGLYFMSVFTSLN